MNQHILMAAASVVFLIGCIQVGPKQQDLVDAEKEEVKEQQENVFIFHKCPQLEGKNQCAVIRTNWEYEGTYLKGKIKRCIIQYCGDCTNLSKQQITISDTECSATPVPAGTLVIQQPQEMQ